MLQVGTTEEVRPGLRMGLREVVRLTFEPPSLFRLGLSSLAVEEVRTVSAAQMVAMLGLMAVLVVVMVTVWVELRMQEVWVDVRSIRVEVMERSVWVVLQWHWEEAEVVEVIMVSLYLVTLLHC
jgi:hypothetical protein